MYFKIALGNVKKSFKDYMIYFLTLMFAVCIFYAFNSISSQKAMLMLSDNKGNMMDMLAKIIAAVSIFVSAILGGLILYGNNFLIKKRKKELGIYMTLGMSKNKISSILWIETILVGVFALGVGLILGIIGAQGLSLVTIKLFEIDMSAYTFMISGSAIYKTILYFSIIFILVMLFNKTNISRYKLIDLLNAHKKNERLGVKHELASSILWIASVIMLIVAYGMIKKTGLDSKQIGFWLSIVLGVTGTFFYFMGLSGLILKFVKSNKNIYFKQLNIFVVQQISSKIRTNIMSMTMICLMLFLTITGLSTGFSFKNTLQKELETNTIFDASAKIFGDEKKKDFDFETEFEKYNVSLADTDYAIHDEYNLGISVGDLLEQPEQKLMNTRIYAIPVSSYNKIMKLENDKTVELSENEVIVTSNNNRYIEILQGIIDKKLPIEIDGKNYTIKNDKVKIKSFETSALSTNLCTLVVPDSVIAKLNPDATVININYRNANNTDLENKLGTLFVSYRDGEEKDQFVLGYTKIQIIQEMKSSTTIIIFVGIYISIIFLLASAAVLSLQQLSEASDSIARYGVLKKIGASKKMVDQTIFMQTLIYFIMPLSLAIIHSIIGIGVVKDLLAAFNKPDIGMSSFVTMVILIIIYGGYFYATYSGYKGMVNYKE